MSDIDYVYVCIFIHLGEKEIGGEWKERRRETETEREGGRDLVFYFG